MLLLPIAYIGAMVSFTGMRKVGLAKYLKPHQVTIAGAVGVTVTAYIASYMDMVDMNQERLRATVFLVQNIFFCLALNQRNEMPRGAMILNIIISALMSALCAFNATECDRYANLVLIILGLLMTGSALAIRSADDARKRENVLHGIWAIFCLIAATMCETNSVLPLLYAVVGVATLLVAKIHHPLLGDKMVDAAANDPESSSWRM